MSVIDKLKELDQQRQKLLQDAKQEALGKAEAAIEDLKELGFHYKLVPEDSATAAAGGRRTGIRAQVLTTIKRHPQGISRADILDAMNARGDKRAEQSISNALSNAKKRGEVILDDGKYKAK